MSGYSGYKHPEFTDSLVIYLCSFVLTYYGERDGFGGPERDTAPVEPWKKTGGSSRTQVGLSRCRPVASPSNCSSV